MQALTVQPLAHDVWANLACDQHLAHELSFVNKLAFAL
jgi:hypothetical protein